MTEEYPSISRRGLLNTIVGSGVISSLTCDLAASGSAVAAEADESVDAVEPIPIIDTNVSLFQWPFRRLPLDDPERLRNKLHALGIAQAWAGNFEGVLHRDLAGVNRRLSEVCVKLPDLIPFGSVNPELPDWRDDVRRCVEEFAMPGIRLHPSYHGYRLDDIRFRELLELATEAGCMVQITVAIEDTRTQPAVLRTEDVDLTPLPAVMRSVPGASIQVLNGRIRPRMLETLAEVPGIYFDTSRLEGTDGVASFLRTVPADRVMYGSHAPFLIPEAALIRVHESNLGRDELRSLLSMTAAQWTASQGGGKTKG